MDQKKNYTKGAVEGQKELTLNLHIKQLNLPSTEQMKVYVLWNRGNKQAKTKSVVIDEKTPLVKIDEKFQINTIMDLDPQGKPTKPKISYLTVFDYQQKDKILGKAELDLSQYSEDQFNILKLKLEGCQSEDASIEVGLKANPVMITELTTQQLSQKKNSQSVSLLDIGGTQNLLMMLNELETAKKNNAKVVKDCEQKEKNLNSKINNLQTQLEKEKINGAEMQKQTNFWNEQVSIHKNLASELQQTLAAQAQALEVYEVKFAEQKQKKERQAQSKAELDEQLIEQIRITQLNEVRCTQTVSDAIKAAQYFFNFSRFDTNFTQAFQDFENMTASINSSPVKDNKKD